MRRLYQQVADALREEISKGAYAVGSRLPAERILAANFHVSRPTVREAIIALEIAGLVEVRVGSGVYVIDRTGDRNAPDELDIGPFELMEARRIIEADIAAAAAARIDDIQLSRLHRLLDLMEEENVAGVTGEQADREFHICLAQGSQNSALVSTVVHLWDIRETSPMLITMLNRARTQGVQPMIDDHRKILSAVEQRDPQAAANAMRDHLSRVIETLLHVTEIEAVERARNETAELRRRLEEGSSF